MNQRYRQALENVKQTTTDKLQVGVNNAIVFKRMLEQSTTTTRKQYYYKKLQRVNADNAKLLVKMQVIDKQLQRLEQMEKANETNTDSVLSSTAG